MSDPRQMQTGFEHASRCIKGARDYQEDFSVFVAPPGSEQPASGSPTCAPGDLLAVLADGMGGHVGGKCASSTACNRFSTAYCELSGPPGQRLQDSLTASNQAIAEKVAHDPLLDGMGCTLIAAAFGAAGLRWVSVGDSLLLFYRRGALQQLNEDHSLAPMIDDLEKQGKISKAQARNHPQRHLLTSYLGGQEIERIDLRMEPFSLFPGNGAPGDCLIIASDGLQTLKYSEIAQIVGRTQAAGPNAVADALITAVEAAGDPYQDNTSIMVACPKLTASGQ